MSFDGTPGTMYENYPRVVGECPCHIWIMVADARGYGRCKVCRAKIIVLGEATPEAKTICKHEGPCRDALAQIHGLPEGESTPEGASHREG